MLNFQDLPISPKVLDAIEVVGYEKPLPIQELAIPPTLEGRDIVGCAQTGTGKTAAFLIPIIDGLLAGKSRRYRPRALVLAPTRELAQQVADHAHELAQFTNIKTVCVYGGVDPGEQEVGFQQGCDIIVATPGRLLDHLSKGGLRLNEVEYFVIDEADRMLDAGFLPDVRRIVDELPARRQTLLFSATMPQEMAKLAHSILSDPIRCQVGEVSSRDTVDERFYPVPEHQKTELLAWVLKEEPGLDRVLAFVRTRAKARELAPVLAQALHMEAGQLHAEMPQEERNETIAAFRDGSLKLLVATDVASRGLDITGLSHVINYDVPNTTDDYIHRTGRTGRVDRSGVAITLIAPRELNLATAIEAEMRHTVPTKRVAGFNYEMDEYDGSVLLRPQRRKQTAQPFVDRKTGKKEKPFTSSGHLRRKFRPEEEVEKPKSKKRSLKKLLNKKLPHQRKRKG